MVNYLVTGVNRGLGLAFLDLLSQDKANTVIGTIRTLDKAQEILDWKRPNIHLIELDVSQDIDVFTNAFKKLDSIVPTGLDVVIHNAGIMGANTFVPISGYKATDYLEAFDVNVVGSIKVYQAISPYLFKGKGTKKFVFISSVAGQVSSPAFITHGYGASKAAVNFFMKQVNIENSTSEDPLKKNAAVFSIHPGVVDTDMAVDFIENGGDAIKQLGILSPTESAGKIISTIGVAKAGSFVNFDGTPLDF